MNDLAANTLAKALRWSAALSALSPDSLTVPRALVDLEATGKVGALIAQVDWLILAEIVEKWTGRPEKAPAASKAMIADLCDREHAVRVACAADARVTGEPTCARCSCPLVLNGGRGFDHVVPGGTAAHCPGTVLRSPGPR